MQTINSVSVTPQSIYSDLEKIRAVAPLIHNITNFVVMQSSANALLALGASPVMAHAPEELKDILYLANALVINIGTLDSYWLHCMQQAIETARSRSLPIIFDPVGSGASQLRTTAARNLLKLKPTVVRGNASEIISLISSAQNTKGVDSTLSSEAAIDAAIQLCRQFNNVIVVSGAIDFVVTANEDPLRIRNGVALMTRVTGMGCIATAYIAAFCAVNKNYKQAAAHAMAIMGISGEIAASQANGPGTFQQYFFDAVYQLTLRQITERVYIE